MINKYWLLIYDIPLRQSSLRHTAHLADILSYSDDIAHLNILLQQLLTIFAIKIVTKDSLEMNKKILSTLFVSVQYAPSSGAW